MHLSYTRGLFGSEVERARDRVRSGGRPAPRVAKAQGEVVGRRSGDLGVSGSWRRPSALRSSQRTSSARDSADIRGRRKGRLGPSTPPRFEIWGESSRLPCPPRRRHSHPNRHPRNARRRCADNSVIRRAEQLGQTPRLVLQKKAQAARIHSRNSESARTLGPVHRTR